jgi:RHS repeat-associated protein
MRDTIRVVAFLLLALVAGAANATTWSAQDYDLYSGDFNGDGMADLLYVAKAPGGLSGIALGVNGGFDASFQSWPSNYLGVSWSGNQYNVVILQNTAAANRRANILLQSKTSGANSFLLQPDTQGHIVGITQPIGGWSADQYRVVAADFNNDGFADVFLQATLSTGSFSILLANASGQFTGGAAQTWTDGFLGFRWATNEAIVYVGDFNGDGYTDLLVQARPRWVTIDYDVPFPVPTYPANQNGIVFAHAATTMFSASPAPGESLGYFAWSRNAFGVDWSPLVTNLLVGHFNGSAYSDVLLQALHSYQTSYLVTATGSGAVFSTGNTLAANVSWPAGGVRLIAGNYGGGTRTGLYFQALSPSGTNTFATNVTGTSVVTTTHDPSAPPPGAGLPTTAGRTSGVFAVSDSGSARYSIPLWSPPGVGRVQLKLSLNYSSRGADGLLGAGWSLGGLSAISRCGRTWAQDGVTQGVSLTTGDRLCLDGQQLKVTAGTAGTPAQGGTTYATEVETFSRIVANGSAGSAPTSFTVTTKNGLIFDYGLTADAQILAGPSGPVRTWALSKVRDRVGNSISLSYYNDAMSSTGYTNGTFRIKEIDYPTTASGQGPFYSVTFGYGQRDGRTTNIPSAYQVGSLVREPNLLTSISIQNFGSSIPSRTYSLTYASNSATGRVRVTKVAECSASSCLPPTTIAYPTDGHSLAGQGWQTTSGSTGVTAPNVLPIDLNGDGLQDLLYGQLSTDKKTITWFARISNATGFGAELTTGVTTPATSLVPRIIIGAFSGTGRQQFLAGVNNVWNLYSYNGGTITSVPTNAPVTSDVAGVVNGCGEYLAADWDGDGLPDLVSVSSDGFSIQVRRNLLQTTGTVSFDTPVTVWTTTARYGISPITLPASSQGVLTTADFNGDGKADLFVLTSQGAPHGQTVYWWNSVVSNGLSTQASSTQVSQFIDVVPSAVLGDWNGDGCTDVLSTGNIYVSDCAGGFVGTTLTLPTDAASLMAADWDGDGRTDLLYSSQFNWYVVRSPGGTNTPSSTPINISAPTSTAWFVWDRDGDGLADLGEVNLANNANTITYYPHNAAALMPDAVSSFTDGFGMNQSVAYVPISQSNYTKCTGGSSGCAASGFPEQDFQGPLYVVSQVTASDGTGSSFTSGFWYYGATLNLQGRGLDGFYARRVQDSRTGIYSYGFFNRAFPYTGFNSQRIASTSANYISGSLSCATATTHCLGSSNSTPARQDIAGLGGAEGRVFPYVQTVSATQFEYGGALDGVATANISQTFTYGDGFGNPTEIDSTVTDTDPGSPFFNLSSQTWISNTYLNDASTSAWCLGLPTGGTVKSSRDGQTPQTRTYSTVPDTTHSLCRIQQSVLEPSTPALTTTQTALYDACGNVSEIDVVGHNADGSVMPTRTTKYDYNHFTSRCQLPEQVTDSLNEVATLAYNYSFGVPSESKDPNGATTDWFYDDFGQVAKIRRPDNTSTTVDRKYCVSASCWGFADLRFLVIRNEYDANGVNYFTQDKFFDGYLRSRFDESNRAFGTWTTNAVRSYDSLGRLVSKSLPFSSGSNGTWSLNYDLLNRVKSAQLFQPGTTTPDRTYSRDYAGRKVTVTDPLTNTTQYIYDVAQSLRRVIEPLPGSHTTPGKTTSYDFDDFGNLIKATDPIGAVWSAQYNLRGFRYQVSDPDAGIWNMQGDSLNELTSWSDPNGHSFSADYDTLGRLRHRFEPEGTSTWTWGSSPTLHEIGSLASVSGLGYSENLTYDTIGRLATRKITSDQDYQYDYGYNSIGAIDTITYPTPGPNGSTAARFKIQYGYSYGFPTQISDVTTGTPTTLWSLMGVNDYSAPTNETMGPGTVSVTSSYTPWTNDLIGIQSGVGGSATNRQNLVYQWDTAGNLHSRSDSARSLSEVFSYDSLNRVTQSTLNGGNTPNFTATYTDGSGNDRGGNITSMSGNAYSYADPNHPHAVTSAGATTYTYDANGNVSTRGSLAFHWSSFNLPTSLQANVGGTNYSSAFSYGPEHERYQQNATYSNGTENTSYAGKLFEKVSGSAMGTLISYRHFVPTPSGQAIVVAKSSDGTSATTYVLTDHLGSSDVLVDSAGNPQAQESFAAYGDRRASNWAAGGPTSAEWAAIAKTTRNGFTSHEELDNIGLVHMNGRVYDPKAGRFLSVDPLVSNTMDSQTLNPYAYVGNRPLSHTDPSGWAEDSLPEVVVQAPIAVVEDAGGWAKGFFDWLFGLGGGGGGGFKGPAGTTASNSAQTMLLDTSTIRGDGDLNPRVQFDWPAGGIGDPTEFNSTGPSLAGAYSGPAGGGQWSGPAFRIAPTPQAPELADLSKLTVMDYFTLFSYGWYEYKGFNPLPGGGKLFISTPLKSSVWDGDPVAIAGLQRANEVANLALTILLDLIPGGAEASVGKAAAGAKVGGASGRFARIMETPGGAVKQIGENTCGSACGQMLTGIPQSELIAQLGTGPTSAERLAAALGDGWIGGVVPGGLSDLMRLNRPWIALLGAGKVGHFVVVDGLDELGRLMIRDPGDGGLTYRMTISDFEDAWITQTAVFK